MSGLGPDSTLAEATAWLLERIEDGARCPLCTRRAQVYRRHIRWPSALALIRLYQWNQQHPGEYVHLMKMVQRAYPGWRWTADTDTKMRYWGLVEGQPGLRADGSSRNGFWRITEEGTGFVLGRTKVIRYARIFDNELLELTSYTKAGRFCPDRTIREVLDGAPFDYDRLMAGGA